MGTIDEEKLNKAVDIVYEAIKGNEEVVEAFKYILEEGAKIEDELEELKIEQPENLKKQLGCPLEVVIHLNWRKPFYYETEDKKLVPIVMYEFLQDNITFMVPPYKLDKKCTFLKLNDYKKKFWLKEDRSE